MCNCNYIKKVMQKGSFWYTYYVSRSWCILDFADQSLVLKHINLMEANSKAPVHNFKIHGYRNNISFILGSPFRRGWGDSFRISESERWYQQAWCALHSETRQQVIRREKLQFPPCECFAVCILKLERPCRLFLPSTIKSHKPVLIFINVQKNDPEWKHNQQYSPRWMRFRFLISTVKRATLAAFLKKPRVNPVIHFQVQSVFACLWKC